MNFFRLAALGITVIVLNACDGTSSGEGIDPGLIEIPIAFIKRPIPFDDMGNEVQADVREPRLFMAGGDVYLRTSSTTDATLTNISSSVTGGTGDVKGLNASFDGSKLIFSTRLFDLNPNDDIVPSWNIYEYDIPTQTLRAVIPASIAEQGDDLFPAFLPDGRIVFSSSRQDQAQANLINEGKQIYAAIDERNNQQTVALVLHVMNPDGSDIHQISPNLSHDLYPQVLETNNGGKIIFSRWDEAGDNGSMHLYTVNPDGSDMQILYGRHSHATGTGGSNIQFTNVREMPDGRLIVIAKPFTGTFDGGDILIIDSESFIDIDKAIWPLAGLSGPAQIPATVANVTTDGLISQDGRYSSAFPLRDGSNRLLVSRSFCLVRENNVITPCAIADLNDPGVTEVSPSYSIWLYDMSEDTAKPIVLAEQGVILTEAITVQAGQSPPVIFDKFVPEINGAWESANVGVINIKSVYDMGDNTFNGCFFNLCVNDLVDAGETVNITAVQDFADPANASAKHRPARFVRFVKPVGLPDPDDPMLPDLENEAFGRQRNLGMREIVGYAPVEPDGSVMVRVPANVPLGVEVLDAGGRRIGPRHNNWFQVQPGDTLTCTGCHTHNTGGPTPEPHGRVDASAPSINPGVTSPMVNTEIPGTSPSIPYFSLNAGETMAEVRFARVGSAVPASPEPQLSADLTYVDYWTEAGLVRPDIVPVATFGPDASFSYDYDDLNLLVLTPAAMPPLLPAPARSLRNSGCNTRTPTPWTSTCRVAINYPRHIQAIWELDRDRDIATDFTPLAPANPLVNSNPTDTPLLMDAANGDGIGDDTCVSCHTSSLANVTRLPYGQLDLTRDANQNIADFYRSFDELLFTKQGQRLNAGGNLENITIQVPDGMGGFNTVDDPAALIGARMSSNGARSSFFIEKMTGNELDAGRGIPATSWDHAGMLDDVELKLISEWLDLGAQNFNDPFDPAAPQN